MSKIFQFRKTSNFLICSISKNNKFEKYYNLENYEHSMNLQYYKLSYISNVRKIETNIKKKN